jgi:hypothetical protein
MQCQQCQREWPDEFEFCPKCGIPIEVSPAHAAAVSESAAATGLGGAWAGEGHVGVSGDVGHDLIVYQVNNYLQGSPELAEDDFRQALACYLTWLDATVAN